MKKLLGIFLSIFFLCGIAMANICGIAMANAEVIDFEDLFLDTNSYWNGSDCSGGFTSGSATFNNNFDASWGSWDGFSYSNLTDTTISGMEAQYNAITGEGADGSNNYAIGYSGFMLGQPTVTFPEEKTLTGAYFTNCNYTYYSMLNGDAFAKKFENGDWFKLTITGLDAQNNATGTVDVFLAEDTNIIDSWIWSDLSALGMVKSLEFTLSSSDTGQWGMNTPAYFCMDSLSISTPSDNDDAPYYPLYPLNYPYTLNYYWDISQFTGNFGVPFAGRTIGGLPGINPASNFLDPFTLGGYPGSTPFSGNISGSKILYTDWPIREYLSTYPASNYFDAYPLIGHPGGTLFDSYFGGSGTLFTIWPIGGYLGINPMDSYFGKYPFTNYFGYDPYTWYQYIG